MFWVVQNDFYSKVNQERLLSSLSRLGVPYCEVSLSGGKVVDSRLLLKRVADSGETTVLSCGSLALSEFAKSQGWFPSCDDFSVQGFSDWLEHYKENLLNHDITFCKLSAVEPSASEFFIRPLLDNKAFDGRVHSQRSFNEWLEGYLKTERGAKFSDVDVAVSTVKDIYAEYRFFVVSGKIVTYSQYKLGRIVYQSSEVSVDAHNFAEKMVTLWQPSKAFVLDIALTSEGYKVVELNNINASGFYACNVDKIVDSLETLFEGSKG